MTARPAARRTLAEGAAVWAASMAVLLVAGLLAGVWRLADLWTEPWTRELGSLALLAAVSALLVGGSVVAYRRFGLATPLLGLVAYAAWWIWTAAAAGLHPVAGLFVALLYGVLALGGLLLLAAAEYALRRAGDRLAGA